MPRRVLFMWFPHLAAEEAQRRDPSIDPSRPFATLKTRGGAWALSCVNVAAARTGLAPETTLADARATTPELTTRPERAERVAAFLAALGRWSLRYTPWIAPEPPDGLTLDLTGCAHLWGGEAALVADAAQRLAEMRLSVRAGLADTKGAAWALAHFAPEPRIAPPGAQAETAADLPVAALRLPPETAAGLARVGLRRIADLAPLPRAALTRRYGPLLGRRLDQLTGAEPEPIAPIDFRRPYAARLALPEPIGQTDDLRAGLRRLLAHLCDRLERDRQGARRLRFSIQRADGGGDAAEIGLARPSHDPDRIAPLFERALDGFQAGFGIDALRLEAPAVEPLAPAQAHAFQPATEETDLSDLISRLGARVGLDRLTRLAPAPGHIPERAYLRAPAAGAAPAAFPPAAFAAKGPSRPLALFPPEPIAPEAPLETPGAPPAAFRWRGDRFELAAADGPERIAPEWWRDDPAWRSGPRDYWRVQTAEGRRLWLFQTHAAEPPPAWFAQGEFA